MEDKNIEEAVWNRREQEKIMPEKQRQLKKTPEDYLSIQ